MGVNNKEIIPATTNSATSSGFVAKGTQTVNTGELGEGESVYVEYTHNGIDWQPLYLNGILQEITPEHSVLTVNGPGKFRCVKSTTAASISVNIWYTGAEQ